MIIRGIPKKIFWMFMVPAQRQSLCTLRPLWAEQFGWMEWYAKQMDNPEQVGWESWHKLRRETIATAKRQTK